MKKKLTILAIISLLLFGGYFAIAQQQEVAHIDSGFQENLKHVYHTFNGSWFPSYEPELIGAQNFKTLTNMRYTNSGIEGTNGYSKINTSIVNASYYKPRSGFHFKKDQPSESHVLTQFYNYNGTVSKVYRNKTPIPSQGNFEADPIHEDTSYGTFTGTYGHQIEIVHDLKSSTATHAIAVASLASSTATHAIFAENINISATITFESLRSRFSKGPNNTMLYSNSVESQVWGGDASRLAAFITSSAAVSEYVTNGKNYTIQVNNEYTDVANVASVGASATTSYFIIGSPRPISGVSFYCSTVNSTAGARIDVAEWRGTGWVDLTETDGTNGLSSSSGKVSFASTVNTSKPKFLENSMYYYYQCQLSSGGASVYNVTLDIPWQNLVDLWDGVNRRCIAFQVSRSNEYKDWTLEVNTPSNEYYPIVAEIGNVKATDHIIAGFEDRTQAIYFSMLSGNTEAFGPDTRISYWNGSGWVESGVTYDGTGDISGVTPLGKTGHLSWQPPDEEKEFPQSLFGVYGYFYKIVYDGTLGGTGASEDMVAIDLVYGIPAPLKLPNFKFSTFYKNRVLLCSYLKGNEPNRIDFSKSHTPDCWNGTETSDNGRASIYVGSGEEITGAMQIYNRYGQDLRNDLVVFKQNEIHTLTGDGPEDFKINTISENIGCPAPYTITSAEIGYEIVANELRRNIIMWLSASGPYLFDNSILIPMKGLENYFNQNHPDYVGSSNIKDAFAWYDSNYFEWNLRVGDYWFIYDFVRRKWYSRNTGTAELPKCAFVVSDIDGNKHVYGGIDIGYMMRLENGTSWDGVPISQTVETGDFYLDNDGWNQTMLRRLKLHYRVIGESSTVQVTHYSDTATSGTSILSVNLSSGSGVSSFRKNQPINKTASLHRLKFSVDTSNTNRGFIPLGWGYQYYPVREDEK